MKLKGVNLGGWLVLEPWITPSLFTGIAAVDETSFVQEIGSKSESILKAHWVSWITEEDFKWIASHGLNAVRIPVGHWIFGDVEPYVGSIKYLDLAFRWAEKYALQVVIDLHAAPGSQNGYDHSGLLGKSNWHKNYDNIRKSHDFVAELAGRYSKSPALWGIELLNEPSRKIPKKHLENYYANCYKTIRAVCGEKVSVIVSDAFQPKKWQSVLAAPTHTNTYLDSHLYQCFSRRDKKLNMSQHLQKVHAEWRPLITGVQQQMPILIGEWSIALDPSTYNNMSPAQSNSAKNNYYQAQKEVFESTAGWFYWTYKTETPSDWSYCDIYESGLVTV